MATVTIRIADKGKAGVTLTTEFDPPVQKDLAATNAQVTAMRMLEAAIATADSSDDGEED